MVTHKKYYNTIAKSYDKLYEQEQKEKLVILKNLIAKYFTITKKTKILDVGCGSGYSSDFDCVLVGVDPSKELIAMAKKRHPDKKFIVGKAEKLIFSEKEFDIIISLSAMQNFDDVAKAVAEMTKLAKKFIFISFPNRIVRFKEIESEFLNAIKKNKLKLIEVFSDKVDNFYVVKV